MTGHCDCPKEVESQSTLSPGLVSNDEPIVLGLITKVSCLDDGTPKLSNSQLKSSSQSVCRAKYITSDCAQEKVAGDLIRKNDSRQDLGIAWITGEQIRSLVLRDPKANPTEARAFCLIDDALDGYIAHAHIGHSEPADPRLKNHRHAAYLDLEAMFAKGEKGAWADGPFKNNRTE